MKISFDVQLREGKSGVEARNAAIRLTGHGIRQEDAVESLKRGILAWCLGLRKAGILENVLERKGIVFHADGNSIGIEIGDVVWVKD
jgi:hypothetical protein